MAETFIHFSCLLNVGPPANAARALDVYVALSEDDTWAAPLGRAFRLSIEPAYGGSQLWMRTEEEGDPETLIRFVLHCAWLFGLRGLWGFTYATNSPDQDPDTIGGGAHLLDFGTGSVRVSIDATSWLASHLADEEAGHA